MLAHGFPLLFRRPGPVGLPEDIAQGAEWKVLPGMKHNHPPAVGMPKNMVAAVNAQEPEIGLL
jgi:hypothetical protein